MNLKEQAGKTSLTKLSQLIAAEIVASENASNSSIENLAAGDVAVSNSKVNATTVNDAITEIVNKIESADITVESATAGEGVLSSTVIKKGNTVIGTINIPKDYVNNIIGIVAEDGNGQAGTFLKVNVAAKGDAAEYQYVDVSGLIEYVESGSANTDAIVINISNDHKVTATITDGSIAKTKLDTTVQASLDKADSALQSSDIAGKADKVTTATADNFAGFDANGNLKDSGSKASDFATAAQGAKADTAVQPADIDEITEAEVTSIWNAAIAAARA